jgi:hypothetical protein
MYTAGGGGFYRKALHTRVVESRIQAFDLWVMSSILGFGWPGRRHAAEQFVEREANLLVRYGIPIQNVQV